MNHNELFCEDSLTVMRRLPDGCVNLVVSDPPYDFGTRGHGGAFGTEKRDFHSQLNGIDAGINNEYLDEMVRLCKVPNIYLFCSKDQLPQYLNYAIEKGLSFDVLTWHKTNPVPTCSNKYLSDTEYIVYLRKGAPLYGSVRTKKKYFITQVNKRDKELWGHPTIKPLSIIRTLITNSSLPGEVVLDPFIGSGTTAVACVAEGRNYIGCEIEEKYFLIAQKRIKETAIQGSLF